jgi:polyhydroxybutyrate depolymerase
MLVGLISSFGQTTTYSARFGEQDRDYILYLPEDLPENAPLVFVFHGYSGSAEGTMNSFEFNSIADKNGFAVCYPEGLKDGEGNHFWQVGYKMHRDIQVDDVNFVTTLTEKLQKEHQLSSKNTFIIGFSNGGDFCNLLLCETKGVFKAAAPIISCMMKDLYDSCQDARPTPLFLLNGTNDDITYWEGDMEDKQGYGPYLSTPSMLEFRIAQNEASLAYVNAIDSPEADDITSIKVEKYVNKKSKNDVWMHTVYNGGHSSPEYFNLGQEIWNFFQLYVK